MRKMIIDGREIKTNYNEHFDYPMHNGNSGFSTMCYESMQWVLRDGNKYKSRESIDEMFERLVNSGYSRITFYRVTTRVRGLYDIIAFCK